MNFASEHIVKPLNKKAAIELMTAKFNEKDRRRMTMQVPQLIKITLNMGVGAAVADKKELENAIRNLGLISGQKPIRTKAKKSVASFKIREGNEIGCKVTLRGERMWNFLGRLIHIAIPRTRDFSGFKLKGFDGRGNYSIGVHDISIFPEVTDLDDNRTRGLDIAITTTAKSDDESHALLSALNFPFYKP